jgi:ATP-dependent Clp protease ATP-binding subunit ClpC
MAPAYSREVDAILECAKGLARDTNRKLSSAHLLLALFTTPNQAQHYLREQAIDEDRLLSALKRLEEEPPGMLDTVLERASLMAEGSRVVAMTTLHLFAALAAFKDSAAYRLLDQSGINVARLRTTAMGFFLGDETPRRFRVKPGDRPRLDPTPVRRPEGGREPSPIGFHPELLAARPPKSRPATQSSTSTITQPPVPRRGDRSGPQRPKSKTSTERDLARRLFGDVEKRQKKPKTPKKPDDEPTGRDGRDRADHTAKPSTPRKPKAGAGQRPRPSRRSGAGKSRAKKPSKAKSTTGQSETAAPDEDPGRRFELPDSEYPTINKFGRNLTAASARGEIDPVVGRDVEIHQLIDILNKRRANNPLLVGDPGVGKTAIVEGLARLVATEAEDAPGLQGRVIVELESGRVFSGTGLRGSLAERLIALKDEVEAANGHVVVFLDEVHRWIGGGGSDQGPDGTEELKPALARGRFPCIGATTYEEYRRAVEADPAFGRRFQVVRVEEPTPEETVRILERLAPDYAAHHQVAVSAPAIEAAARLSHRYVHDRRNPDKAITVLDLAGSRVRRMGGEMVDQRIVAEVVAELSGIPASKLLMADRERFLTMEDVLMKHIVGQERALARIAHVLRRNYAGFVNGRPIGSFLFLGPTGVGKTETAKVLADFLFHSREALTSVDMSEYREAHTVSRLLGAPPGYVGHDAGGILTEAIRRRPYQILLFDEIEKSHAAVQNLLLQLLEEGRLTDSRGRPADFTNAVVILTSNLGAEEALASGAGVGFGRTDRSGDDRAERVRDAARRRLEPELWNRIDEQLVFDPLSRDQVERIALLKLQQSSRRLLEEANIAYSASPAVVGFLIEHGGYDPKLGARPMRRALERFVEGPIADLILSGEVAAPAEIQVDVEGGELVFDIRS